MVLHSEDPQQVSDRISGTTGGEGDQNEDVTRSKSPRKNPGTDAETSRVSSSDKDYDPDLSDVLPRTVPPECRTYLLTQAATLAGSTAHGAFEEPEHELTPSTSVALESPSSLPATVFSSPASHSFSSPSPQHSSISLNSKVVRKRGVPHTYRDYTNVSDTAGYVRKKTGGVTRPFPEKLHEMLDQACEPEVVGWLPHGRAFIVRKPKEFTTHIMPKYFRQTKLTSFQRQLNLYGFRRLTQGQDAGAYYHELFLRGRPQLCIRMQRQKVKGTGHKQPADAKTEPNFYSMAPSNYAAPITSPTLVSMSENPSQKVASRFQDEEVSPGTQGLRGAANLLKNIASGTPVADMGESSFSLGQAAMTSHPLARGNLPYGATMSTTPGGDHSKKISLLGRVNMNTGSLTVSPQDGDGATSSAAFFWPPLRRARSEPKRTRATVERVAELRPETPSTQRQDSAQSTSSSQQVSQEKGEGQGTSTGAPSPPAILRSPSSYAILETSVPRENKQVTILNNEGILATSLLTREEGGRMEKKVSNGIETEEV